jgi:uncharacterized protein (TIGR03435 family)
MVDKHRTHSYIHARNAILAAAILSACALRAQEPVAAKSAPAQSVTSDKTLPAYDVISVKPNNTGSGHVSIHHDDGNFDAFNVSLTGMILDAYGMKPAQLIALPPWADSAHFDIKAKVVNPDVQAIEAMTRDQSRAMLWPILTDRFGLKFHRETRLMPVYKLVLAKGGTTLTESKASGKMTVNGVEAGNISMRRAQFTATAVGLPALSGYLSDQLRRIVIDETGLTGKYDLLLTWSPDDGSPPSADANSLSIFTALEEQLGLELQPGKAMVEVMVIDHAQLPAAD